MAAPVPADHRTIGPQVGLRVPEQRVDQPGQVIGVLPQVPVGRHGAQFARVERHVRVERGRADHEPTGTGRRTVLSDDHVPHQIGVPLRAGLLVVGGRSGAGHAPAVPPRRMIIAGLPRVHDEDQPAGVPAGVQQPAQRPGRPGQITIGHLEAGSHQLGDRVPEHRRLGDRRRGLQRSQPGGRRGGPVPHVRHHPALELTTDQRAELLDAALVTQTGPGDGVEGGVPQPLVRIDGGIRNAVADVGPPVRVEDAQRSFCERGGHETTLLARARPGQGPR